MNEDLALRKKYRLEFSKALKKKIEVLCLEGFVCEFKKDILSIISNGEVIASLYFRRLTGKHIRYGAVLTIAIEGVVISGSIMSVIKKLNLSYFKLDDPFVNGILHLYSGTLSKKACFKDLGAVSFYLHEDVDSKLSEFLTQVSENILLPMQDVILCKLNSIEHILEYPSSYSYPVTFIIIICFLNNRMDLVPMLLEKCKVKKLKDYSDSKIKELLEKIQNISLR